PRAVPVDRLPIAPGTVLAGKYRVERVLGQGGMGVVVEARHVALDERVALKFLLEEYAAHPNATARFVREARAAAKIRSEHVARVSDVGTLETGTAYMVMEFLEGSDLAQVLLARGPLPVEDAVEYIVQACDAIAIAHANGIVHRDLKPANLFLASHSDGSPLVKVLDFGISKVQSEAGADALTRTSAAMGSALYMSPEQIRQAKSVDHRTDIYALGISLFELLSGRQPFIAETFPALCVEIATGVPADLRALRPGLPGELVAVVERAFARERDARYQSIAELALALAPFAPARSRVIVDRIAGSSGLGASGAKGSQGRDAETLIATATPAVSQPGAVTSSSTSVTAFETTKKSNRTLFAVLGVGLLLAGGAWALVARSNLAAQEPSAEPPPGVSPKAAAAGPVDHAPAEPAPLVAPAPADSALGTPKNAQPAPSSSAATPPISSGRAIPVKPGPRSKGARPSQGSESGIRGKSPDEYR
ncbi:MAG TPA: serine/threonine-protein kinase, partial [Polyangiaceae bacterium]